jgi:hypothetical protein|tara:strand:+ start:452 stop:742 length:291 start_codon:yes stop_codon:yes gene_type:complete
MGLRATVMNNKQLEELSALRRQKREWELQRATLVAEQSHDQDKIIALMEDKVSLLKETIRLKAMLVAKMPPSKPYEWTPYDEADSKGISHPTDQTE